MLVWKIEALLKENLSSEEVVISDICRRTKEKFDKYCKKYSIMLAFGANLDPQIKLSMFEYFYEKVDPLQQICQITDICNNVIK